MNDEDFSPLSEGEIAALATPKVLARGRALFDDGALEELARNGDEISAVCVGSEDEVYSLSARVAARAVTQTRCSCPYDYEGICKHLVALLLAWAHMPEAFEIVEAKNDKSESALFLELKSRERAELAHIVCSLVETEPKLRSVVKRLLQKRLGESEVAKSRRAVEAIFKRVTRHSFDGNFSGIARDLKFHLRGAASLESSRPTDALRLYAAILEGMMAAGEEPFQWDESGNLTGASTDCAEALVRLVASTPVARHGAAMEVAARAFVFDLHLGGYGFAEGVDEILTAADDDQWLAVEPILDAALDPARREKQRHVLFSSHGNVDAMNESIHAASRDFVHREILQLKAERMKKRGDAAGARRLLLGNGTPTQQVEAHLENRDFDAATQIAQKHFPRFPGLLHQFADQLEDAGEWPRARAWAHKNNLQAWLASHAAQRGESDALELNVKYFKSVPSREQWRVVMQLAPSDERETLKTELRALLKKVKAHAILFDIALEENEVSVALDWWEKLSLWEKGPRHEALATAAESAHPDEAFLLWSELAESLIARRSRDYYRLAAKALKSARRVLEKHGRGAEWPPFIAALREKYPTLRALQEELTQAKLTAG
jgi:uncharacterized Zn finger protein